MTASRWTALALPAALAASPLSCGKQKTPPTTPPTTAGVDDGAADGGAGDDGAVEDPGPPQEPDPAELAKGRHEVLLGHYQAAIDILDPLYNDLKEREQYRAGGLAGAWLAIAHAQIVFENAAEPTAHAVEMAEKTKDNEVEAAAKLARGAALLAEGDFPAGAEAFAAAAAADPSSPEGMLALIWDGESLIGSAFGGGSSIVKPEDLEAAKVAYGKAAAAAPSAGAEKDILLGRAEEGLAAVADYQKARDVICTHAFASIDHYKAAGAADFLVSGPSELATKYKCKP